MSAPTADRRIMDSSTEEAVMRWFRAAGTDDPEGDPGRLVPIGVRWAWLFGGVWLIYLSDVVAAVAHHAPGVEQVVGALALAVFVFTYLLMFALNAHYRSPAPEWERTFPVRVAWLLLLAMGVEFLLVLPAGGARATSMLVYIVASAVTTLPPRSGAAVAVSLVVAVEVLGRVISGWDYASGVGLAMLLAGVAVWGLRIAMERNRQLSQARMENARLAVADERARMARDVHDILGHSLTVITVKAELAGRLLEVDAGRAAAEIADVERLSREALADVRAAISGYRQMTLNSELASARTALRAAGIEADVEAVAEDVPPERRELYGWAVREGVTNVVRHSGARRCVVRVGPDRVEVIDDGVGPQSAAGGNGLLGLRERAEQAGARVSTGPGTGGKGFRLALTCASSSVPSSVPAPEPSVAEATS